MRSVAIIQSILTLAHGLGMRVVAEGIERLEQSVVLTELGCQTAQGYYFSRPQSAGLIEAFVRERHEAATRAG